MPLLNLRIVLSSYIVSYNYEWKINLFFNSVVRSIINYPFFVFENTKNYSYDLRTYTFVRQNYKNGIVL